MMVNTNSGNTLDRQYLTIIMLKFVQSAVLERDISLNQEIRIDWDELMNMATEQGLLAWVWEGICKLPNNQQPSRQYRINWGLSAQEIVERYEHQKEILAEMVEICNQNGIRLLLLKGIGLSELYPNAHSRPSGDLDVFFFEDYEKGNMLFGDGVNTFYNKHASFDYKGVHIENHKTLVDTDNDFERNICTYLHAGLTNVCVATGGFYTLNPLSNLIYLITHTLRHFDPYKAVPLRNIIDIYMYMRHYQYALPTEQCHQMLSKLGLEGTFELFLRIGEILLDTSFPNYHMGVVKEEDLEDIKQYVLKGGSKLIVPENLSFGEQVRTFFTNYRQVKKVYKYMPSKTEKLLYDTFRQNISLFLKRRLSIREDESFSKGIKKKLRKMLNR